MSECKKVVVERINRHKIKVLLVDDQAIFSLAVQEMLKDEEDIEFYYCDDPNSALKIAREFSPTVILQDLVMPQIDGLTLLKEYRMDNILKHIPKIVMSSKEESFIKAKAFSFGANDYLVKLPDKIELIARIRYHSNSYIYLLERNEAYEKLAESKNLLLSELKEAALYVKSALPLPLKGEISSEWIYIPSLLLGGDVFGYHWLDSENFAFYLIDVCGHGVGAALLSITVMNVLRSKSFTGVDLYDPKCVLCFLNEKFPMEKHKDMFFTMWYGLFNKKERKITYSNAGHPPPILLSGKNRAELEEKFLKTEGSVVGAMQGIRFYNESCFIGDFSELFIFSDGVFELLRPDGSNLSYRKFAGDLIDKSRNLNVDTGDILEYAYETRAEKLFEDDFSLVKFSF